MESKPGGKKHLFLEEKGYSVVAPLLDKNDFAGSVATAQKVLDEENPDIVVGSSRGGAVAMALKGKVKKILIAPAWKKFDVSHENVDANDIILHSERDEVVSYSDSVELCCSSLALLQEVDDTHRMNNDDTLDILLEIVKEESQCLVS